MTLKNIKNFLFKNTFIFFLFLVIMVVDYTNLDVIIGTVRARAIANRQERRAINQLQNKIAQIKRNPNPNNPSQEIDPIDQGLGTRITSARINRIYDQIVIDEAAL